MDERRFDAWIQRVSTHATSRADVLGLLAGGAFAALSGAAAVTAGCARVGRTCASSVDCCVGAVCRNRHCKCKVRRRKCGRKCIPREDCCKATECPAPPNPNHQVATCRNGVCGIECFRPQLPQLCGELCCAADNVCCVNICCTAGSTCDPNVPTCN